LLLPLSSAVDTHAISYALCSTEGTAATWSGCDTLIGMRLGSALGGFASLGLHGRHSTGRRA